MTKVLLHQYLYFPDEVFYVSLNHHDDDLERAHYGSPFTVRVDLLHSDFREPRGGFSTFFFQQCKPAYKQFSSLVRDCYLSY